MDEGRGVAPAEGLLIGREAELTRILKALEAVSAGQGRMVLLSGEPGIGKTRLGREVLARASRLGARACAGRSFEQHTAVPFFPFTEALTLPLAGPPLLPQPWALERWPELARLLPDAAAGQGSKGGQSRQGDHENQLRIFRAVTAFLRAVAEVSPLALLLDDLHWADATSLSLLMYLGRHLAGSSILLLGTYRDVETGRERALEETVRELMHERLVDELRVKPLSAEGTAGLIRQQLASQTVSDELVALLHARAEGNPFFTEELLKELIEQGGPGEGQARWEPRVLAGMEVPRSVRSVVAHRVSRLPPATQELLRLASVIGQEVETDLLVAASEQSEAAVEDHLDAALAARLLEEAPGGGQDRYAFVHALIQQAVYSGLSSSLRRRLHRQIGDVLTTMQRKRPLVAAELARHFLAAGDVGRALGYTIEAGDQAAARYAHAEAARHYRVALDRLLEIGERARGADVQYRLARELHDLNQLADALAAYQAALGTFELLMDTTGQARVHWGIGLLHRGRYDIGAAIPHFDAALRLWPAEREDAELAALLLDATRARIFSRDSAVATSLAARAMAVAERCDEPGLLAPSLILLAATRMLNDSRPSATVAVLDRAERVAQAAGDWRALSYVYLARADLLELSGELDRTLADRRAAVEAADRSGETERLAFAHQVVAETHLMMGAWEEGRVAARKGLALDQEGLLKGTPGRAYLTWMIGRPQDALAQMAAFAADARRKGDLQGLSRSLAAHADMALQIDRPLDAAAPAREAADLLRVPGGWRELPGVACGPLAETLVRLAAQDAEDVLATAEHMLESTEQHVARPQLLRARGLLLRRQGRLDAALEALAASAAHARSQLAGIQLGRTLDILAAVARQRDDAALALGAETELLHLIERIGPEVSALTWARRGATRAQRRSAGGAARARGADTPVSLLTPREREVAVLVARGLTNRQIADALVIAEGTAGVHVDHILNKLGFRSRAQVAAWTAEHGLLPAATR